MLIEGTTTTDSSSNVEPHRLPNGRHGQLQIVEGSVALDFVEVRQRSALSPMVGVP